MWIRNAAEIVTGCDLAVTCCDDQVKQHVKTSLDLETESFDLSLWKKLTWTMNAIRKRFGRITRTQRGDVEVSLTPSGASKVKQNWPSLCERTTPWRSSVGPRRASLRQSDSLRWGSGSEQARRPYSMYFSYFLSDC